MSVIAMLPAVACMYLVWRLRKAGSITISLASALAGLAVFSIVFLNGIGAGVPIGTSLFVGLLGFVAGCVAVMLYLLIWRKRGGRVGGRTMPWW